MSDETEIAARAPSTRGTQGFELRVERGRSAAAALRLDVAGRRFLVGSSEACDLRLEDKLVSRRHIALALQGDGVTLHDLDSTNGTFIGGVRVLGARLFGGEEIRLGECALRVVEIGVVAAPPTTLSGFGGLVGASAAMRAIYPLCERLAQSDIPALIEGETGTGKEVLAESIHLTGPRRHRPFVVFDCTASAPTLLESELFGHEKGSFTGASSARAGVFEQAAGGTLLIDEIGDLDLPLQAKLLRAIERLEIRRVGGDRVIKVDVRILAATRRDLDREVQRGRFRDDLFHRLVVGRVELPPLRARKGDVSLLAKSFAERLGGSSATLPYELLLKWEDALWPGNVRELRNAVARRIALGDLASSIDAPRSPTSPTSSIAFDPYFSDPLSVARQKLIDAFERAYVTHVLAMHGGDIDAAAAASGIARRQFFRLKAKARGPVTLQG